MIPLSDAFDLGRDLRRMKDPRDGLRQTATAAALLQRLFHDDPRQRWDVQILADEVGMGKTFVSLAVAYSLLEALQAGHIPVDLDGCYQKVVILTPSNVSLFAKWHREVSEFVRRCVAPERREEVERWFKSAPSDRLDDFVRNLRKRGTGPRIVLAPMDVFGGRKLQHLDLKRRFLLGALFRHWGNAFRIEQRQRLLRGAPEQWPNDPYLLAVLDPWEADKLPCSEDEAVEAIRRLDRLDAEGKPSRVEVLLEVCREIAEPYRRDRFELFNLVDKQLAELYRATVLSLFGSAVPLVIVDEAHNWKNGPSCGANGYALFRSHLASRTRRALLLTATPFQLRPQEMLELIKIGEDLRPAPERSGTQERRDRIKSHREVLGGVLEGAGGASRRFAKAWSRLATQPSEMEEIWASAAFVEARQRIAVLTKQGRTIPECTLRTLAGVATAHLDPAVRVFFGEALAMFGHNRGLSSQLGAVVVRHRRKTEHRVFRVGHEYGADAQLANARFDRHVLHAAKGLDVRGEAELPHYLLMRCISDTKGGRGRSALGSALTGCYSTLRTSADGSALQRWIDREPGRAAHFKLLLEIVDRRHDPRHPKVAGVVAEVLRGWQDGEKTLLFCFRTNTAERLHEIIRRRIEKELAERRKRCLGGEDSLRALRGRMTRRDGDLMPLGLDRVIWSLLVAGRAKTSFSAADLQLCPGDVKEIARLCLVHGLDTEDEKADRVFLHRATEHALAKRLAKRRPLGLAGHVLARMADRSWIEWPYGLEPRGEDEDSVEGEEDVVDGRGLRRRFPVQRSQVRASEVEEVAGRLMERRARAVKAGDVPVLDTYADGPSIWFGGKPSAGSSTQVVERIHDHLAELSEDSGEVDLACRQAVVEALRRAVLRESVLVRVLPSRSDRHQRGWGELLVEALHRPVGNQGESTANHIEVFLEDLRGSSGRFDEPGSARHSLLDATRLRDQRFVALVKGGDQKSRERVFAGFNTPLLPEVLVCTSVGAEGIDLHRHCRHVVHYDLAWNPAVLEQRTGRIDRIGSKAFRERALAHSGDGPFLEVGVPFLAGTYDERMYEELRLRAQMFEVLTGGDMAGDDAEGRDADDGAEGAEKGLRLVTLPGSMVEDLRVRLHVWTDLALLDGRPGAPAELSDVHCR